MVSSGSLSQVACESALCMNSSGILQTSDCTSMRAEPDATANDVCPGVWPGVAIDVIPGATSLLGSYWVTFSPSSVFLTLGNWALLKPFALLWLASSVQNAHSTAGTLISAFAYARL